MIRHEKIDETVIVIWGQLWARVNYSLIVSTPWQTTSRITRCRLNPRMICRATGYTPPASSALSIHLSPSTNSIPTRYTYGGNSPITNNDPTGLYGWSKLGAQLGGWGGGVLAGSTVGLACAGSFGVGRLAARLVLGGAAAVPGLTRRSLVEPLTTTETPQLGVQSRADFRVVLPDS